ncbi:hypothetical protein O1611_g4023 [Lasiodiplodia mahajangana]|uniref:Uncharacterized protein n=1 Tax=Lasiodiplodia mahajangana TaxID=1108764 RepID=A0ACC2JQG6_9PEZI|nr:hypothetical protein O1611_g4023 [Lasiodiplodia mahajangana]
MSDEMKPLTEFHYFPKLPPELQEMVWALYGESTAVMRHNFHCHSDPRGGKSYHYILYDGQAMLFTKTHFRYEEDELSSVHGALTVPGAIFPYFPRPTTHLGSKKGFSFYIAVNYEQDIFNFSSGCCGAATPHTETIANWFRIPFQPVPEEIESSSCTETNDEELESENETQHRIFSARRIAFYAPSKSTAQSLPTYRASDMQMLARFKRLKEIIFVVERIQDLPISIRERARSMPPDQHPVFGGLMTIAYLNSRERLELFNRNHMGVSARYALDLAMYEDRDVRLSVLELRKEAETWKGALTSWRSDISGQSSTVMAHTTHLDMALNDMGNAASREAQPGGINPAMLHRAYTSKIFCDLWRASRSKANNSSSTGNVYEYVVIKTVSLVDDNYRVLPSDPRMPREFSISGFEVLSTFDDCHDANESPEMDRKPTMSSDADNNSLGTVIDTPKSSLDNYPRARHTIDRLVYPKETIRQQTNYFQSRPEISERITEVLIRSTVQATIDKRPLAFVVSGLGGTGKTELARDFSIRNYPSYFDVVLFLVADQRERLSHQYADVACALGLIDRDQIRDLENARERLKLWFESPFKRTEKFEQVVASRNGLNGEVDDETEDGKAKWLLVLDNADKPELLLDFWPVYGAGSILVTSRNPSSWKCHFPETQGLTLGGLDLPAAISLLRTVSQTRKEPGSDSAATEIVERFERLPLAIVQIGSAISKRNLSLKAFVNDYVRPSQLYSLYEACDQVPGYEHNLASVWAFDVLEEESPSSLLLLNITSVLDPSCIQEEVLFDAWKNWTQSSQLQAKDDYHKAVSNLIERSMLTKDTDDGSLQIHRLVQAVARARLTKQLGQVQNVFELAWTAVAKRFPYRDQGMNTAGSVHRWEMCATMYPHVRQLRLVAQEIQDVHPKAEVSLEFLDLVYEAAWWQCERREAAEAADLVDFALAICDIGSPSEEIANQTLRTPLQLRQTAFWACKITTSFIIGDQKAALLYSQLRYQSAQNEYKATGKVTGFQTSTLTTLGQAFAMNRLYDKAVEALNQSVNLRKQMPKFERGWLCTPLYHLGITHHCMGRLEEAAGYLEEAISAREENFGFNDRVSHRKGAMLYALANVRNSQGRFDNAYGLHHQAFLHCRQTNGECAYTTLKCAQKLAEHYERYGLDQEARPLLQNILSTFGQQSDRRREVAQAAFLLSTILSRHGKAVESRECRHQASVIYNELCHGEKRAAVGLTWTDVKLLISYDYF